MKSFLKNHGESLLLISAAALGLLLGPAFPDAANALKPIGTLWLNLLFTAVVPLVFFSISATVSRMTDAGKFSRIVGWMFGVFITASIISSVLMLTAVKIFPPSAPVHLALQSSLDVQSVSAFEKMAEAFSTGDFVKLLSRENMLALIIFSALVGWAAYASGPDGRPFREHFASGNAVMMKLIGLLMKAAPLGLMIYFANLAVQMGPQMWGTYRDVLLIYYPVAFFYFFVFFTLYALLAGGIPYVKSFWGSILKPALTAFGTGSSLAAIPANMQAAEESGVPRDISEIVIPVGASVHKSGSCISAVLKIAVLFAIFNQPFHGFEVYLTAVGVAILSGVVMSGIPGGAFLGEMLIVTLYGFPAEALPIISMVGTIVDPPATLVNALGDNIAAGMVSRAIYGKSWRVTPMQRA